MESSSLLPVLFLFQALLMTYLQPTLAASNSTTLVFREYIGAESMGVKFSDVPIHPDVEVHFILSFAIDYMVPSATGCPQPTNGKFNIFWDTGNLTATRIANIKRKHNNVKVALSLGGDSLDGNEFVYFNPTSIDSWVDNAICSLTSIIQEYDLDGIDIDYEHFNADPETFVECIGRLVTTLKDNGVIKFASIAPYANETVQSHYIPLWKKYGHVIDYVNFQFYAYDEGITVSQFLTYFETQRFNYEGGKILASISTEGNGGLIPEHGFFSACESLKMQGKLAGIFIWCADSSKANDFHYEKISQNLLASKPYK